MNEGESREGREGREIRVWVEGDRKKELVGEEGCWWGTPAYFKALLGNFREEPTTQNVEILFLPTQMISLHLFFMTSTLIGWRQVLRPSLQKPCSPSWRGTPDRFQNATAVFPSPPVSSSACFFLPGLSDTVVDEITCISLSIFQW